VDFNYSKALIYVHDCIPQCLILSLQFTDFLLLCLQEFVYLSRLFL